MSRNKIRMIKMGLGVYLMIVGILLSIDVYDQKPNNMQVIFVVASILIIVGLFYVIQDFLKVLEKIIKEKAELKAEMEEEERIRRHQELHSSDKFRTAPMPVVKPVKLESVEENLEEFDEKSIIVTDYEEEKHIEQETVLKDKDSKDRKTVDKETEKKSEDTSGNSKGPQKEEIAKEEKISKKENKKEQLSINIEKVSEEENKENDEAEKEEN